jgi:hypothetical protein
MSHFLTENAESDIVCGKSASQITFLVGFEGAI